MFLIFLILWIIFNANFTLEILIIGLVVSGAVFAFICKFMDYSIKKEINLYKKAGTFIKYVANLLIEVVKANVAVTKLILTEKEEICPALVEFDEDIENPVARTLLANAITITPGTITAGLEDNHYMVHCLDEDFAEGLEDSVFVEIAKELDK